MPDESIDESPLAKELIAGYLIMFGMLFIFAIFMAMLVLWPLMGTLMRFRAHCDSDDSPTTREGGESTTRINSYWMLVKRVRQVEVSGPAIRLRLR